MGTLKNLFNKFMDMEIPGMAKKDVVPIIDLGPVGDIWEKIPNDVKELLFYTHQKPNVANHTGINTIELSFDTVNFAKIKYIDHVNNDPSTIYFKLPIKIPENCLTVNKLPYMPSYIGMNPEQRYIYLTWLMDITQEIDVGYKFVFYYGLERMLIIGKFEKAVEMIIRLRKVTTNNSFLHYSGNALFYTVIRTGNDEFLDKLNFFFDDDIWSDKQVILKLFQHEPIEPHETVKIIKGLDVNKRYLDEKIYIEQMAQLFSEKYGHSFLRPQEVISEDNYIETDITMYANFSLPQRIRIAKKVAHPLLDNFTTILIDLHNICHERTKKRLAELRKKN